MSIAIQVDLLVYSILISILLLIYMLKNYSMSEKSTKFFIAVLASTLTVSFIEVLAWIVDSVDNSLAYNMNWILNVSLLCLDYIPGFFWLLYFDYKIIDEYNGTKRRAKYYFILEIIIILIVFTTLKSGFIFNISSDNVYQRGSGVYLMIALHYMQYVIALFMVNRYRRNVNAEIMSSIIVYMSLPVLGALFQIAFYGLTLIWPMFTLANMIAFVLLEKDVMLRDPLTGIYTRGEFEQKVLKLIHMKSAFTLIMFDLDKFKEINDTFGHQTGDEALTELVDLVTKVKRKTDMLCRYGGDEFMILVRNREADAGEKIKKRIENIVNTRNAVTEKKYNLYMSFGMLYVGEDNKLSQQQILEEVDQKMYDEKTLHREKYQRV